MHVSVLPESAAALPPGLPPVPRHGRALISWMPMVLAALDNGATPPEPPTGAPPMPGGPWRDEIVRRLNDSLLGELVSVLRFNHLSVQGQVSARTVHEFLLHANEEMVHAHRLVQHIAQLGGEPDYPAAELLRRCQRAQADAPDLRAMIELQIAALEHTIRGYGSLLALIGRRDRSTADLVRAILVEEQAQRRELVQWLRD